MKSEIECVVHYSKKIETMLEKNFNATGKGLHEKLNSANNYLPTSELNKLRWIATMRNKVVHEDGFHLEDRDRFETEARSVIKFLEENQELDVPETLIDEFKSEYEPVLAIDLRKPYSVAEIESSLEQLTETRRLTAALLAVSIPIGYIVVYIYTDGRFLDMNQVSKIESVFDVLHLFPLLFTTIFMVLAFLSIVVFGISGVPELEEFSDLECILELESIASINPVVRQYVRAVGQQGRKLTYDEVCFLAGFHDWFKLQNTEKSLYQP